MPGSWLSLWDAVARLALKVFTWFVDRARARRARRKTALEKGKKAVDEADIEGIVDSFKDLNR